jgi:type IV pilus biogenesis protein CpaD/CtpE
MHKSERNSLKRILKAYQYREADPVGLRMISGSENSEKQDKVPQSDIGRFGSTTQTGIDDGKVLRIILSCHSTPSIMGG